MRDCKHEWFRQSLKYSICSKCGEEKFVRFPLKDKEGKIIVKNLFKMDLQSIMWLIVIIIMITTYRMDMAKCDELIYHTCSFCNSSGCCEYIGKVYDVPMPDPNFIKLDGYEIQQDEEGFFFELNESS